MIEIQTLYLIKSIDKSPYVVNFDTDVFGDITLPLTENYVINSLDLIHAVYKFSGCARINLSYSLESGYEKRLGFNGFNGMFNYTLNLLRKSIDYFDFPEALSLNQMLNDKYQIVLTTIENVSYIVYAELDVDPIDMLDDSVFQANLIAGNVKEGIFRINTLTTDNLVIDNDLSETPSVLPLDYIMTDKFIVP